MFETIIIHGIGVHVWVLQEEGKWGISSGTHFGSIKLIRIFRIVVAFLLFS